MTESRQSFDETFDVPLHFVSGKGGVGKSTIACALALHFCAQKKRVLLVQVNAHDAHVRLLEIPPAPNDPTRVDDTLYVANIRPEAALKEYARMILRFDALVDGLLDNRVTHAFLRFIPSLPELNLSGKIWFHAVHGADDGAVRFDKIVVDLPATGHGIGIIDVARTINEVTRGVGPMAEKTTEMERLFRNPKKARLHIVTLLEEMPVNETLEMIERIRREKMVSLGAVIANRAERVLFNDVSTNAASFVDEKMFTQQESEIFHVVRLRMETERAQKRELGRLESLGLFPVLLVDEHRNATFGRREVETIANLFDIHAATSLSERTGAHGPRQ